MSGFARNAAKLMAGSVGAQLIAFAMIPIITRYYSPEMFGVFSVFYSLVAVTGSVSTLRFSNASMLPQSDETAADLVILSISSVIATTILVLLISVGVCAFWPDRAVYIDGWFLLLVAIGVMLSGCLQSIHFWSLRETLFTRMGWSRFSESVVDRSFVLLLLAFGAASFFGLLLGRLVGLFTALVILLRGGRLTRLISQIRQTTWKRLKIAAHKYRNFPLYSTWAYLLTPVNRALPVWVLMAFYSPVETGFFALGQRVLNVPAQLSVNALSRTFLQKCVQDNNNSKDLAPNTLRLLNAMLYVVLPTVVILTTFGGPLFRLIFGSEWEIAGRYVEILSPSLAIFFLYRICSVFFDVFEQQKQRLLFDATSLIFHSLALLIPAGLGWTVINTLIVLNCVSCIVYLFGLLILLSKVEVSVSQFLLLIVRKLVIFLPLIIGVWRLPRISLSSELIIGVVAVVVVQLVLVCMVDKDVRNFVEKIVPVS